MTRDVAALDESHCPKYFRMSMELGLVIHGHSGVDILPDSAANLKRYTHSVILLRPHVVMTDCVFEDDKELIDWVILPLP